MPSHREALIVVVTIEELKNDSLHPKKDRTARACNEGPCALNGTLVLGFIALGVEVNIHP